jgi:Fe-S-cluster-containing dehydrogenase component/DMSO reductase anchor subunit
MNKQKAFYFDLNRCTGCGACVIGCTIENQSRQDKNWRDIYTFNPTRHPSIPVHSLSMACNHCVSPACLENCPASAIYKDKKTGAVIVDPEKCMGCKYCTWACPFDVPKYSETQGVIEKCDFCVERLQKGEAPACVCACPVNALRHQDWEGEDTNDTPRISGFTPTSLEPAITFKPLRPQQGVPEATAPPPKKVVTRLFKSSLPKPSQKITLKSEWALLIFTSIAYMLVALLTASVSVDLPLNPIAFLGAGIFGMGLSTIHLGQKGRAYRAIFNIKRSWLSREIFLFSAFLAITAFYRWVLPESRPLGWFAVAVGFLSLFAVDRLYQVALHTGPLNFHSANTFFTGLYVAGILTANIYIAAAAGGFKLVLYFNRKRLFYLNNQNIHLPIALARIGFGFMVPAIWLTFKLTGTQPFTLLTVVIVVVMGEWIDRAEFYDQLDVITPDKQMLVDIRSQIE